MGECTSESLISQGRALTLGLDRPQSQGQTPTSRSGKQPGKATGTIPAQLPATREAAQKDDFHGLMGVQPCDDHHLRTPGRRRHYVNTCVPRTLLSALHVTSLHPQNQSFGVTGPTVLLRTPRLREIKWPAQAHTAGGGGTNRRPIRTTARPLPTMHHRLPSQGHRVAAQLGPTESETNLNIPTEKPSHRRL